MNLVVDIGNTRIKYGVFDKGELVEHAVIDRNDKFDITVFLKQRSIRRSILSAVVNHFPPFVNVLKERTNFLEFNSETKIPVKNLYRTANTLGNDRLPAVIAAQQQHPGKDVLVIDSGTCIKYNFINAKGEYLGGGISPGIDMRFKALNTFTDRLPLLTADYDFEELVGTSSVGSLQSGVMNGVISEASGIRERYEQQYPGLVCVITGGNAGFFEKRLKKPIFADPFLVLKGLNIILEHNAK
ncbi:MAG TPA: type III pantothenate kinase [Bacteroidia bacterium]|jgi:type III pantothenate kinase